jgi:hypothetical protein
MTVEVLAPLATTPRKRSSEPPDAGVSARLQQENSNLKLLLAEATQTIRLHEEKEHLIEAERDHLREQFQALQSRQSELPNASDLDELSEEVNQCLMHLTRLWRGIEQSAIGLFGDEYVTFSSDSDDNEGVVIRGMVPLVPRRSRGHEPLDRILERLGGIGFIAKKLKGVGRVMRRALVRQRVPQEAADHSATEVQRRPVASGAQVGDGDATVTPESHSETLSVPQGLMKLETWLAERTAVGVDLTPSSAAPGRSTDANGESLLDAVRELNRSPHELVREFRRLRER